MRRTILVSLFFLGACGGGGASTDAVKQPPGGGDARLERINIVMSQAGQEVVASFRSYNQEALDTCLSAWIDGNDAGNEVGSHVQKPNTAGLRAFLSQCLASSEPGGFRNVDGASARSERTGALRKQDDR